MSLIRRPSSWPSRPALFWAAAAPVLLFLAPARSGAQEADESYDAIKKAIAAHDLERTKMSCLGGSTQDRTRKDGSFLVGLKLGLGKFTDREVVYAVAPIFSTPDGNAEDKPIGLFADVRVGKKVTKSQVKRKVTVTAKPGYAVAGVTVKQGMLMDSIEVQFARITDGKLDLSDTYSSDPYGDGKTAGVTTLRSNGSPVVGIAGREQGGSCSGIGLVLVKTPSPAPAATPPVPPVSPPRTAPATTPTPDAPVDPSTPTPAPPFDPPTSPSRPRAGELPPASPDRVTGAVPAPKPPAVRKPEPPRAGAAPVNIRPATTDLPNFGPGMTSPGMTGPGVPDPGMAKAAMTGLAFTALLIPAAWLLAVGVVFVSFWKVFEKAGQPGWAGVIPVYNVYVLTCEIARKEIVWFLLMLVPCLNVVAAVMVCMEVAKRFGKSEVFGLGLTFLGVIFWPVLAFGKAEYLGGRRPQPG